MANTDNTKNNLPENAVEEIPWDLRPYEEIPRVGVLDPYGKYQNPLTGKEYSTEYKAGPSQERHWSKLPFNDPVAQKKAFEAIQKNQIILVKSGTGSGKSSQVPKFLSHLLGYRGRIAITIPTQVSTLSSAQYMAKALDVNLGEEVGFQFRGKRAFDEKKTRILFTTDGTILSRMLGSDPDLKNLNALVIDEAHKRSSNIDMILLLAKELIRRRPNFKLLIVSATINAKIFRDYFPSPFRFVEVEVTSEPPFPITEVWAETNLIVESDQYIKAAVSRVMKILTDAVKGDILVFLPTVSDLTNACTILKEQNKENLSFCVQASGDIFRSDAKRQELVVEQQTNTDKRKVVMSTAVAEESITIKNIDFVVDSGLNLMSSYDFKRMANILNKEFVTKSSAKQRAGRTGRLQPGTVYHLYTKKQFEHFPEFDVPEIQTINMAEIILKVANMPLMGGDYKKAIVFLDNLIEPPTREAMVSGVRQLQALNVFTKKDIGDMGELTVIGKAMAQLAMEPGVAKTLLIANERFVRAQACFIYAILDVTKGKGLGDLYAPTQNQRERYSKIQKFLDKRGDYFTMLKIYNAYEKYKKDKNYEQVKRWCQENYLKAYPLSQVRGAYFRLINSLMKVTAPDKQPNQELSTALQKEIRNTSREFKTDDAKLSQSIQDGEGAIRKANLFKGDKYKTTFPPVETVASLGRDTQLPPKAKLKKTVIYNDLFITDGQARLNTVLFV